MDWKSLGTSIAKLGLPLLGAILPIPGGAAIGTALASQIGSPSASPEDIFARLTQSAEALQKAHEFELTHQETMMKMQMDFFAQSAKIEEEDRASARNLAEIDISHGNAITSALSAFVRPAWGLTCLILFGYSIISGHPLDATSKDIMNTILMFYFGGKVIETITPHVTEALATFGRNR